jgi:oligopeptide transport system substrate-binding protein
MHKRNVWLIIALVAALVVVAGVAAACGSSTTTTTAPAGPTTTAAGPTTTAAGPTTTAAPAETTTSVAANAPQDGGTFRFQLGEPSFIEPSQVFESEGVYVDQVLFDGLLQFDQKTLEVKPDVATSWEVTPDGLTWTFKLRNDSKWQNGRGVVASDFVYSWTRQSAPETKSNYGNLLSSVVGWDELQAGTSKELAGVTAPDDYTLQIKLKTPVTDFLQICAMPMLYPVLKEAVEADPKAYAEMPVGNGPFKMAEPWKHNEYIKVVKWADYPGTKPHVDGIDFRIYKDDATAYLDFQAGNLDYVHLPTGQYKDAVAKYGKSDDGYLAAPGKQVLWGNILGIYEVVINTQNPLFKDNPDLRQALCLAVNRQAIVDTLYDGTRQVATSIIPPGTPGYEANAFQYAKYDVEAAKAALAKAGYPDGKGLPTIPLSFNNNADHGPVMQLVQADLKAIGINTTLDGSPAKDYWAKAGDGGPTFFIGRSGWIEDYPSIDNITFNLYNSAGGNNYSHVEVPEIDKAINEARSQADPAKGLEMEKATVKMIGDYCPDIPIMYYSHYDVTSDKLHDAFFSAMLYWNWDTLWLSK